MKRKGFLVGMLVLALVFGMTVVGCNTEKPPGFVRVENGSSYTITRVIFERDNGAIVIDDFSEIPSTQNKSYDFDDDFTGKCKVTVTVASESVNVEARFVSAYPGEPGGSTSSGTHITLKGNSKETLKF